MFKIVSTTLNCLPESLRKFVSEYWLANPTSVPDSTSLENSMSEMSQLSPTVLQSELKQIDEKLAITGKVVSKDPTFEVILSEGSLLKSLADQIKYAQKLGCRLATQSESIAYFNGLLQKERNGSANEAEIKALKIYRECRVRDSSGGVYIDRDVASPRAANTISYNAAHNEYALFVVDESLSVPRPSDALVKWASQHTITFHVSRGGDSE